MSLGNLNFIHFNYDIKGMLIPLLSGMWMFVLQKCTCNEMASEIALVCIITINAEKTQCVIQKYFKN